MTKKAKTSRQRRDVGLTTPTNTTTTNTTTILIQPCSFTPEENIPGSVEVIVQQEPSSSSSIQHDHSYRKQISKPPKTKQPIKQISNIIKRMKPPIIRRHKSASSTTTSSNHDQNVDLALIKLRKAQSAIVTPKMGNISSSSVRHKRSSSDFGTYQTQDLNTCQKDTLNPAIVTKLKKKDADGIEQSSSSKEDHQHNMLLVPTSTSDEDDNDHGVLGESRSESDLLHTTTTTTTTTTDSTTSSSSTTQTFYNMITSSWRTASTFHDDNKENEQVNPNTTTMTPPPPATTTERTATSTNTTTTSGDAGDTRSLVRKASTFNIDDSTTISSDFFFKEDFDSTIWSEVNATNGISILGAAVMTATVVIHPLVFVAGAATAVWAVGFLHGLEKGYQYFSDVSFNDLFWDDSNEEILQPSNNNIVTPTKPSCSDSCLNVDTAPTYDQSLPFSNGEDLITPISNSPSNMLQFSPPNKKHLNSQDEVIKNYFPDLECAIVKNVEFPGLNALEFFEVYFANEAPYSFKEFQATKGDIDIKYSKWSRRSNDNLVGEQSFHPKANRNGLMKFPTSSRKEREQTFKTLTKSYFGPTYASAKKTQRVTKFSTRLVIIESKTELFNIPFSDRFFVVERWVIEAQKHDLPSTMSSSEKNSTPIYTTNLSVFVEVFMLKSCNWERQIREKTLSTLTGLLEEWTTKATRALDLATRKKMARRRIGCNDDGTSIRSYRSNQKQTTYNSPPNQEEAMKKHHQKLKVIEEKIFNGDMDWCNIEIRHSEKAGAQAAYAEILEDAEDETSECCPQEISVLQKKKGLQLFRPRRSIS